jgi:uncharacterized protein (TIGR00661 family)
MKEFNSKSNRPRQSKTILVAPLHWGLGHATRCIPIIRALIGSGYDVIIGSDGAALSLLQTEFPDLESLELPSYDIQYSTKGSMFKLKLFMNLPHISKTISLEKKLVKRLVGSGRIDGIISDNRLGVHSIEVPTVFITHQLNVLSGNTSWISSKAHQKVIRKFNECWVPDIEGPGNLSGRLGHLNKPRLQVKYIGPLSRMTPRELPKKYDIMCLLSGPEPQRSLLEEKLTRLLNTSEKKVLLVRGVVNSKPTKMSHANITTVDYLTSEALEKAINESEVIVSRSGYTTIMDLAAMGKKAFFIPTPGQYEQEYLAGRLRKKKIVPSCRQDEFSIEKLNEIQFYKGLGDHVFNKNLENLFHLFKGE